MALNHIDMNQKRNIKRTFKLITWGKGKQPKANGEIKSKPNSAFSRISKL